MGAQDQDTNLKEKFAKLFNTLAENEEAINTEMLAAQGIIPSDDCDLIVNALIEIEQEIEIGEFPWDRTLEDIHMNIESRLHEKIGAIAGKLHTARSRNDQVCLDMRMYVKKATRHTLA